MDTPPPPPLVPKMLADFEPESAGRSEAESRTDDSAFGSPVVPEQ